MEAVGEVDLLREILTREVVEMLVPWPLLYWDHFLEEQELHRISNRPRGGHHLSDNLSQHKDLNDHNNLHNSNHIDHHLAETNHHHHHHQNWLCQNAQELALLLTCLSPALEMHS